ncbi:polysaccharide deacetylase family protein [Paenibacillus sp. N3.4]|nr:polysaccharide deacetylase family protein [Paenibacillus sp. N3.4]
MTLLFGCSHSENKVAPLPTTAKQEEIVTVINKTVAEKPAIEKPEERVIHRVNTTERKVALTFDDGPDNKYTPKILNILKTNDIKATFFVIGEHAEKYPEVMKRIAQEGHAIGNHSWDHANLAKLPNDRIKSEITDTDTKINSIVNQVPVLFRAPYGVVNNEIKNIAASTGHQIIGWSVDTLDWDGKSVAQILAALKKEVKPGAIILQHSAGGKGGNLGNTIEALPQIITYLKQNGYSFATVPDLLKMDKVEAVDATSKLVK